MEKENTNAAYVTKDQNCEENEELTYLLSGLKQDFVTAGPKTYVLPKSYSSKAADIYNFPLRSDDIFIITFPKSGTTLTQELVWLICNNLDYDAAQQKFLNERFPFLEMSTLIPVNQEMFTENELPEVIKSLLPATIEDIKDMPSPRFIKSHLALSLLPPSLLDKTKVVYVARDPRDVAVSFYHHNKLMKLMPPDRDFKLFWKAFVKDNMLWAPIFEHILEAWKQRHHPNMLFMFYEDMTQDLPEAILRVANFFNKSVSDEEMVLLVHHLLIDNFKKNKSVNLENLQQNGIFSSDGSFIRKGKIGEWKEYFDEEMTAQAEEWIKKNLHGTDFRFPE